MTELGDILICKKYHQEITGDKLGYSCLLGIGIGVLVTTIDIEIFVNHCGQENTNIDIKNNCKLW